jgi:hypothetical protein
MTSETSRETYVRVFRRSVPLAWTRETAYATGLVASDGYLSAPRYVGFGSQDLELVQSFLHSVGRPLSYATIPAGRVRWLGQKSIVSRHPYYQTLCSDPLLYEFLISAGLGPRKSRTLGPIDVPALRLPDVIRGLLDGDGSIMTAHKEAFRYGRTYQRMHLRVVFYSSSKEHLAWLRGLLTDLAIRSSLSVDRRPAHPSFSLTLSDRQSAALLTAIYEDPRAPRLARKHEAWLRYRDARSLPDYTAFL